MLVQELVNFTSTYIPEALENIHLEEKPVHLIIVIDEQGQVINVEQNLSEDQGKKSKSYRSMLVPRSPVPRNSGVHPMLAFDSLHYVVGSNAPVWGEFQKQEKDNLDHEGFKSFISRVAADTGDAGLLACQRFFSNPLGLPVARKILEELKVNGSKNLAFRYSDTIVHLRPAVLAYWKQFYLEKFESRHAKAGEGFCMITGEFGQFTETHDKIKGASKLGGKPSGVNLMSFDKGAFQSYNWNKNANSPLGVYAANAHVLALNKLLTPGDHLEVDLDGVYYYLPTRDTKNNDAFLFWTRKPSDVKPYPIINSKQDLEEILNFDDLVRYDSVTKLTQNQRIKALLNSAITGKKVDFDIDVIEENTFFLLCLSANGGRLVVKDFYQESLKKVVQNMRSWYQDQLIADIFNGGKNSSPVWIRMMFPELVKTPVSDDNKIRWDLVGERLYSHITTPLLKRSLFGIPLGYSLLARALSRYLSEPRRRHNTIKMGLLRLIVNDVLKKNSTLKENQLMQVGLDKDNSNIAYICGRMMAIYEQIQFSANQKGSAVGNTVVDRFYSMATTYPLKAFTGLKKLSDAHLKKLRRDNPGAAYRLINQLHELYAKLPATGYPHRFSLDEQGIFAIGYHHQAAADAAERKAYFEAKAELSESNTTEE
jgi:CRISPR-associated protein Csd1